MFDKDLRNAPILLSKNTMLQSKSLSENSHFVSTHNFYECNKTLILCCYQIFDHQMCCTKQSSQSVQSSKYQSWLDLQSWLSEEQGPQWGCWEVFRTWRTSKTFSSGWTQCQVPTVDTHLQTNQTVLIFSVICHHHFVTWRIICFSVLLSKNLWDWFDCFNCE